MFRFQTFCLSTTPHCILYTSFTGINRIITIGNDVYSVGKVSCLSGLYNDLYPLPLAWNSNILPKVEVQTSTVSTNEEVKANFLSLFIYLSVYLFDLLLLFIIFTVSISSSTEMTKNVRTNNSLFINDC